MNEKDVREIKELLKTPKKIVVVTHLNPDADAIGSAMAMSMYLERMGHKVTPIIPNDYPDFLAWLPRINEFMIAKHNIKECVRAVYNADVVFCLDFNVPRRVGEILQKPLSETKAVRILIDHHEQPDCFCKYTYSRPKDTSSASECVYDFITKELGDEDGITFDMAQHIYSGIITDTGSLSYGCNNVGTYHIVAKLIGMGVDAEAVHKAIYNTYTEDRLRLLGFSLTERFHVIADCATAYMYLTKADLERFHHKIGDTEGIVNYGLTIGSIKFTALFTERDGYVKASFRSKGTFDVNKFAQNHYTGGGHRNAAGADCFEPMEKTIQDFERFVRLYKDELTADNK